LQFTYRVFSEEFSEGLWWLHFLSVQVHDETLTVIVVNNHCVVLVNKRNGLMTWLWFIH